MTRRPDRVACTSHDGHGLRGLRETCGLVAGVVLVACLTTGAARAEVPAVVASIKPIHGLVAAVMQGVGEPILLLEGAGSPHVYALRPSDARALDSADLVFWVGDDMETFLTRPLRSLAADAEIVTLMAADGLDLLPAPGNGVSPVRRPDPVGVVAPDPDDHANGRFDTHVWLDPRNARAIVAIVADRLAVADPANAAAYAANAVDAAARIDALAARIADQLAPIADTPYVAFHDAYRYFERRFGLSPVGALTVGPEASPGAAHLVELRARIRELEAVCVFGEPQFEPRMVDTVVAGAEVRRGMLDPLGDRLEPGPGLYFDLMDNMADAFADCLTASKG